MILNMFQSTMFKRFNKILFHCAIDQMILSQMQMTRLINLHVIDIKQSYFSRDLNNVNMKSIMIV